ncbi:MAG: transcription termination/antitermination protein NusA [Candidatus Pacebacteria bacterium]|nr:transcription termination/antitermination protein NusA [Candidatus Paceibacterota bacterium]
MDLKTLASAVIEIAEEKGISQEKVIEVIEDALASAYKKEYGQKKQKFEAKLNPKTGRVKFWQVKQAVDKKMILSDKELEKLKDNKKLLTEKEEKIRFNPDRHIMLQEAKKIDPKIKKGEYLKIPVESKQGFGRIAAQTAKQVILQKIKEAEREVIMKEFKGKEGEIISGIVQRVEPNNIYFDIGKTSGILPKSEQVSGEFYRPNQRLKLYVLKVEDSPRGPTVLLSRAYPKLISRLFELEVPEISAGQIVIKSIAREPGSRTKIAVEAEEEGIDPIGSLVGQRGTRISAVINELGGEKIDVVKWSDSPEEYITNALSPAKILEVKILLKNKANVLVPNDQLSLTIGKNGQNVRLAAKLTGWKIDIIAADKIEEKK